jgi:hypothetical protein
MLHVYLMVGRKGQRNPLRVGVRSCCIDLGTRALRTGEAG